MRFAFTLDCEVEPKEIAEVMAIADRQKKGATVTMQPPKVAIPDIDAIIFDRLTQSLREAFKNAKPGKNTIRKR